MTTTVWHDKVIEFQRAKQNEVFFNRLHIFLTINGFFSDILLWLDRQDDEFYYNIRLFRSEIWYQIRMLQISANANIFAFMPLL